MTKSKRRKPRDRLSELPDSLIFHIFWFLPMKYVVRTTVLSSRWKTLWTTTPYLNFDCTQRCCADVAKPRNFVNRALLSWKGIKILKFKIEFRYVDDDEQEESLLMDFALWIRFAVEKKVEELYLHGNEFDEDIGVYHVPQWLYSCSSLKVISLIGCYVNINGNVSWSKLKSLTMDGGSFDDRNCEHTINQVLCGAPQLEVLILGIMDNDENLSIRSSSLRKLSIKKLYYYMDPSTHTELRIWTPNLETLEILGDPGRKCLLMNVSSLTHATLDFNDTEEDIIEETLSQILPTIQHVQTVTLSSCCIKVLVHMTKKHLVSPFSNVKFLKLKIRAVGYEQTVGVLEIFPTMKMLVLLDKVKSRFDTSLKFDAKSCLKFVANLPKSFLPQLRTVKITWVENDDSIFPFIEIMLKYASNLEKMVIRVEGFIRPTSNSLFLAAQKLLNMPRSSPNCTVDLL